MHKKKPYFARFLALLLSTTTVFGSVPVSASSVAGSSVLESADSSGDTQNPDGSDSSGDTQNPDGSDSSGDTRNPDGSDSSGDTQNPDSSDSSSNTQNPDSSDSSGDAQNPDNSDSSGDTQNPDSSDKDDNEEEPEVSYSKIHFITLPYNSDAILLESNGHFGMIDSGEDSDYPDGSDPRYPLRNNVYTGEGFEQQVIDYMHSVGVTQDNFDFYLGTHPHSDHIGSADEVIREFHPQRVYLMEYKDEYITSPGLLFDNLYVYDKAIEAAKEVGSTLIQNFDVNAPVIPNQAAEASTQPAEQSISAGTDTRSYSYITEQEIEEKYGDSPIPEDDPAMEEAFPEEGIAVLNSSDPNSLVYSTPASTTGNPNFNLGDLHLQIMNYSDDYKTTGKLDANYFSLGVKVTSDSGYTAFLSGDIGFADGDEARLSKVLGHIDVLKLGHHGIANSNSLEYLNALSPTIAIQSGLYKVLPEDRIELLNKLGARLYSLPKYTSYTPAITLDMDTLDLNVSSSDYFFYSKDETPYLSSYLNGREKAYTGFVDYDGETYHFSNSITSDEKKWIRTNATWYYADAKGALVHGWLKNGNYYYYLKDDGSISTGLCTIDDDTYFFDDSGQMLSAGWKWINKKCYYFQKDGTMAKNSWIGTSYVDENGVWDTSKTTTSKTGWKQDKNGWWYVHADGSYTKNGWETIDGEKYYFDSTGYRHIGWLYLNQTYYYFDLSTGILKTGWVKSGKYWYYMNEKGIMQTGWREIDDKWYYLNSSGMMQTGWLYHKQKWYYLNISGVMQTGWVKVGNNWYYLDSDGIMQTGWTYLYTQTYYLNKSGIMQTGWQTLNNKTYYFDPTSGAMKTKWLKIGTNQWYYLNENGTLKTGWQTLNNKTYYFETNGLMQTGWKRLDSKWYYFGNANDGAMKTYWQKVNNAYYFLGSDGIMRTGWQSIWGKWYYLNSSGAMLTGWQKIDNNWYLLQSNGARIEGWYTNGKNRYYLMPLTGVMQKYWFSVDGKWYYANYSGVLQTGWVTSNGKTYYLDESGVMQTGLKLIDKKWYVFSASGELIGSN